MTERPLMMKDLPEEERPREKLFNKGAQALSSSELLAILIRTGRKDESVMRVAERLLNNFSREGSNGLSALGTALPQEITKVKGLGKAKAVTIAAAIELGKRMATAGMAGQAVIRSPQDAAELLMPRLRYERCEQFVGLMLSVKNHVVAQPTISVGTINASLVDARELFRMAIGYNAASVIVAHNHPSGDPTPSGDDIKLTKRLLEAGQLLDIPITDHVIIGDGRYISMREQGII